MTQIIDTTRFDNFVFLKKTRQFSLNYIITKIDSYNIEHKLNIGMFV